jgi:tetratricopeptide (TPR) repeat protein
MGLLKSLFGKSGWDRLPQNFVSVVKSRLGDNKFTTLDSLAKKYNLFNQRLFKHPEMLGDDLDFSVMQLTSLLTSMGNELDRHEHVQDAMDTFLVALSLKPDHSAARGSLSILYYSTGNMEEAKKHAAQAVSDMDKEMERMQEMDATENITSDEGMNEYREMLLKLASGKKP